MTRRLSDVERHLSEKWLVQRNRPALSSLHIKNLRCVRDLKIDLKYPVTIIAGANGTGKSTILGAAACAYHQDAGQSTFIPRHCIAAAPYYTFKDFFIGSSIDGFFQGAEINWSFFENGRSFDLQISKQGAGKWMHYERRPRRPVVYFGIDRVLPAMEKKILRSHFGGRKSFLLKAVTENSRGIINSISQMNYTELVMASASGEDIYRFTRGGSAYTSFHSGAGEEVVCEICSYIDAMPNGGLVLIEELEVGLHPLFQKRILNALKQLALDKQLQIIATTHSHHVLEAVPGVGRVLLRRTPDNVVIEYGVKTVQALSSLSGETISELAIYVEDELAVNLIKNILPVDVRRRVRIEPIGGFISLAYQLSSFRIDERLGNVLVILDGDVYLNKFNEFVDAFAKCLGRQFEDEDRTWMQDHVVSLPGDIPEKYCWETLCQEEASDIIVKSGFDIDEVKELCAMTPPDDWHNVIYMLQTKLALDKISVIDRLSRCVADFKYDDFEAIRTKVMQNLGS